MIPLALSVPLPVPWNGQTLTASHIGAINFLVGPNGSGKSRFAEALQRRLPQSRLLGTDRLNGMDQSPFRSMFGDFLAEGLAKNRFPQFKQIGTQGSGIDAIILLEERLDLRIQVEATLSHLFNRRIRLEWDSGHLVPRAAVGDTGALYRLDREECHGIKELLVLLTHLYNPDYRYLIIDEPELNLHPQYQAFFMQEVRRVAGDPADPKKKVVFLVTHSPFILDFKTVEDLKCVISFDLSHSVPKHILDIDDRASERLSSLVARLNVHHKQLFFSDNPIFVEGLLDARLIATLQEARGVSIAGAGSCIIDAGGCEEVNHYLDLCNAFAKRAYFVYDLDSLFGGNLRACLKDDGTIQHFLRSVGVGGDLVKYCGELERTLTSALDLFLSKPSPPGLQPLAQLLLSNGPRTQWSNKTYARVRVAFLTALSRHRVSCISALSEPIVTEIEGRLQQVVTALRSRNVFLLSGGTIERYLPAYQGDEYALADESKRAAVEAEVTWLANQRDEATLAVRYGELFDVVKLLPGKRTVDTDRVLRDYLSHYIHELQMAIVNNAKWSADELNSYMSNVQKPTTNLFRVQDLTRGVGNEFSALVRVSPLLGSNERCVRVSHNTNAGMRAFAIEPMPEPPKPSDSDQ